MPRGGGGGAHRALLAVCFLTLTTVLSPAPAAADSAASPPGTQATEFDNEYLLLPYYRDRRIGDLIPTLVSAHGPPLVLAEAMLEALMVEFDVSDEGAIRGRRHPGDVPFRFEPDGRWQVQREGGRLEGDAFRTVAGELYLSAGALSRALPLELTVDTRRQRLEIRATGPLPLDLARHRELARVRLGGRGGEEPPPVAPFPYAAVGRPAGDLRLSAQHATRDGGDTRYRYDGLIVSELGYATGLLFFRGDEQRLSDARLRLGRESTRGSVFGVPGLVSAFAGDVTGTAVPLVGGMSGRGVSLSAYPLDRPDSFDQTTVDGDAPAGWEVELYRDNELLFFDQVGPDGRYEFADVPMLFGNSTLRLVFYGPEGQIREEVRDIRIGAGMTPPGTAYWRVFAGEQNRRVLDGLLSDGDRDRHTGSVYALEGDVGLSRHFSATAFATRTPESFARDSALVSTHGGGLRMSLPMTYLEADLAAQSDGGRAWGVSGVTGVAGLSLTARHARYEDFRSFRATRGARALASETRLRAAGSTRIGGRSVGLSASGERWSFDDGDRETELRVTARFSLAQVYLTQALEWRRLEYVSGRTRTRRAWQPGASTSIGRLRLALSGRYDLDRRHLQHLQLSGNWRFDDKTTASFGASRSRGSDEANAWSGQIGLSRDFGSFRGNVTLSRTAGQEYLVGVGLNTAFGFDRNGSVTFSGGALAQHGAADVFLFHDRANDGRFDPAVDEALPGAGVRINHARRAAAHTGSDGRVFIPGLNSRAPVTVSVDPESIPDPFLTPTDSGVRFVPRPGQPFAAKIALVDSGEISGTLTTERNGQATGLANVVLELVRIYERAPEQVRERAVGVALTQAARERSRSGGDTESSGQRRTVQVIHSQYDGSFLFDLVPPGRYVVRVRDGQAVRGAPIDVPEVPVELTPDQLFPDDVELRPLQAQAERSSALHPNEDAN